MRTSSILISGAVAAVTVAGSANAGVVDSFTDLGTVVSGGTLQSTTIRSFSTSGLLTTRINANTSTWVGASSLNNSPGNLTRNGGAASLSQWTYSRSNDLTYSVEFDLSNVASFSITSSAARGAWYIVLFNGPGGSAGNPKLVLGNTSTLPSITGTSLSAGVNTLTLASGQTTGSFDLTKVNRALVYFAQPATGVENYTLSNFTYALVPAPGAVALLGVAGLAARRRRR